MGKYFSDKDIVLFQGDSITESGRNKDDAKSMGIGYPALTKAIYKSLYPRSTASFVNRGVSGNRVRNLLERYEKDFLEVKPDFISIMIGINDTWRAFSQNDPCPLPRFEKEYVQLLEQIKADLPKTRIMLIEPFVLHSLPDRKEWHSDLDPKRKLVSSLAKEYADFFLPLHSIIVKKAEKDFSEEEIAADGVHPTPIGHALIAAEYLKLLDVL